MWTNLKTRFQILKLRVMFSSPLVQRLMIFFGIFGPATITAMADNDAAGVATYSLAGAKFGYSILFILLITTVLLAITQEMGVRIAIVTGKGLGDLIRERFGVRVSFLTFTFLFFANLGTIIADYAAIKATGLMFHVPVFPLIAGITFLAFFFIWRGSYQTNQRIFLFATIFYIAYIISAFKASPNWGSALSHLILPLNIPLTKEFILSTIAVVGTTITPWGQFFVNSYVIDKKLGVNALKYEQLETYFGAFLTDFFSFFMIVATAATLFMHGISLTSGEQAALAIKPFAGNFASLLFGLGLFNAGFMGIVIIALSTSYAFSEFFGTTGSLDAPFSRGRSFYLLFLLQIVIAAIIVLLPSVSFFQIVVYTQALNGILLPFVFYFLLKITNNTTLMGKYTNSKAYNYFAIISSAVIILASIFTIVSTIFNI